MAAKKPKEWPDDNTRIRSRVPLPDDKADPGDPKPPHGFKRYNGMVVWIDEDPGGFASSGDGLRATSPETSQVDPGTFLVYDSAMGSNALGAVWIEHNGEGAYIEYVIVLSGKTFPFKPANNGSVRFTYRTNTIHGSGAAFETWLTNQNSNDNGPGWNISGCSRYIVAYTPSARSSSWQ